MIRVLVRARREPGEERCDKNKGKDSGRGKGRKRRYVETYML